MKTKNRNLKIFNMAGITLATQVLLFFIAKASIMDYKVVYSDSLQTIELISFVSGLLLILTIVAVGLFSRKAYQIHVVFSVIPVSWIIPFIKAGYILSSQNVFLLMFIIAMCLVNIYITYKSTTNTLNAKDSPATLSGRLNLADRSWDLSKQLYIKKDKYYTDSLAKLFIPIGSALGVVLYRSFSDYTEVVFAAIAFMFSTILITVSGTHLATAMYIKSLQEKHRIKIYV